MKASAVASDGRDHPAFARGEVLRRVEAEAREIRDRADLAGVGLRLDGVRRVLDQREVVQVGERTEAPHVGRVAAQVHDDDPASAGRDGGLDGVGVEIARNRIHVGEHRRGARVDDRVGGRAEGQRRRDDLVARADARRQQREVQRRRARVEPQARAARPRSGQTPARRPRPAGRSSASPIRAPRRPRRSRRGRWPAGPARQTGRWGRRSASLGHVDVDRQRLQHAPEAPRDGRDATD